MSYLVDAKDSVTDFDMHGRENDIVLAQAMALIAIAEQLKRIADKLDELEVSEGELRVVASQPS